MKFTQKSGSNLEYVVASPDKLDIDRAYGLIILLHGYGSHMGDLAGLASEIDDTNYIYLCPNAPIEMDVGFGQKGYAWYPISSTKEPDDSALSESITNLNKTIGSVISEYPIDKNKILIGGFSQGGMMTIHAGLLKPELYAGAFILSSRMLKRSEFEQKVYDTKKIPVFMSHGLTDMIISIDNGRNTRDLLNSYGYEVEYHEYDMAHQIVNNTIEDLRNWITNLIG